MTTIPPSPHHLHRPRPPPSSSSQAKSAPPSGLAIATAVVRRLVREQSSYVVELTGQEARLAELSQRKKGGDEDEDENWDYRVKQEERALQETRAVFGPLSKRILAATEKLEDMLEFETCKDEKEVQTAKDMVATARQHITNDPASTPGGVS